RNSAVFSASDGSMPVADAAEAATPEVSFLRNQPTRRAVSCGNRLAALADRDANGPPEPVQPVHLLCATAVECVATLRALMPRGSARTSLDPVRVRPRAGGKKSAAGSLKWTT